MPAIGSMLAQADMGQSNMRDYADHYARICAAVEIPVYVDADTGFGGVNNVRQMVRAFEAAGVAGLFISDQVFPNRCGYLPGKQVVPVEQMLAKVKAALDARRDADLFIAARTDAAGVDERRCRHRALPAVHGSRRRHGQAHGRRHHRRDQAGAARGRRAAHGDALAGGRPEGAQPRRAGSGRRLRRDLPVGRAVRGGGGGAQRAAPAQARATRSRPCQEHLIALDDYYDLVGLKPLLAREESYDRFAVRADEEARGRVARRCFDDFLQRRPYNAAADFVDANVARGLGDKTAFVDPERSMTYARAAGAHLPVRGGAQGAGPAAGGPASRCCSTTPSTIPVAFWGAVRAGIVVIPLNTLLTARAVRLHPRLTAARPRSCAAAPLARTILPILDRLPRLRTRRAGRRERRRHGRLSRPRRA